VFDSYTRLAATATVDQWLVLGTEKFTDERLQAMVHAEDHSPKRLPGVLFLCVHNAGRSQMALGWFRQLAGDRAVAWSGGSHPESDVNDDVVTAMAEVSVDISQGFPKPWTDEFFGAADVVITMGCATLGPLIPGKHYEDWELEDPAERHWMRFVRSRRDQTQGHQIDGPTGDPDRLVRSWTTIPHVRWDGTPADVRHNSGRLASLTCGDSRSGRHVEAGRMVAFHPPSPAPVRGESRAHCERWIAWRVETGQHDGFLEFLAPVLTAPLELRFRELDPE